MEGGGGGGVDVCVGEGEGEGDGDALPEPKVQLPVSTPMDSGAKNLKRPSEKSSPLTGQPGH